MAAKSPAMHQSRKLARNPEAVFGSPVRQKYWGLRAPFGIVLESQVPPQAATQQVEFEILFEPTMEGKNKIPSEPPG
jgi:hypothetical protein